MTQRDPSVTRRDFVKTSAALTGGGLMALSVPAVHGGATAATRVGVIGCGGRGTGAAHNALAAGADVRIVALADLFADRMEGCRNRLRDHDAERGTVAERRCYTGFDAYERLLADGEVDYVILATPPHFRPIHLAAAVASGVHVFMEKPAGVDPSGIRSVLDSARIADEKGLSIVAGTQRRHERSYLEAVERVRSGAIGTVIGASCAWNQGGLWSVEQTPEMSDMEWQIRNWLYFTWLSGDHIVEQHVHNIDVVNWILDGEPVSALGLGGREVRTEPVHGHIFDHFSIEFEYAGGQHVTSMCRQIDGCASRVEERIFGTKGTLMTRPGFALIEGENAWRFEGDNPNPYVQEHRNLLASIHGDGRQPRLNEAARVARSTLTAVMGRTSAYTGKQLSWDQISESKMDLAPAEYAFTSIAVPPVAVPGRTPFV